MRKSLFYALPLAMVLSAQAQATTYHFNMTYDGTAMSLNPGSADPGITVLQPGDSFMVNLHALGSDYWHVNTDYNVFVPLSFSVYEGASRLAEIATNFLNNGVVLNSTFETNIGQNFVHVGAQNFDLPVGFDFDQVVLTWTMLSISTNGPSTLNNDPGFFNGFGQTDAPFVDSPKISYIHVSAIPLPAALPLLATALAGAFGAASRRRKP
jgi:hypothetical protein